MGFALDQGSDQNQLRVAALCGFAIARHGRNNFRSARLSEASRRANNPAMVCLPAPKSRITNDWYERLDTSVATPSCKSLSETEIACPPSIRAMAEITAGSGFGGSGRSNNEIFTSAYRRIYPKRESRPQYCEISDPEASR